MDVTTDPDGDVEREVQRKLTRLLFRNAHVAFAANVASAAMLAWVNASMHFDPSLALGWWVCVSLASVGRMMLSRRFNMLPATAPIDGWRRTYLIATALVAGLWGLGVAVFAWNAPEAARLFSGLLAAGLVAGAATVLAPVLAALYTFMFLISLPLLMVTVIQASEPIHFGFAAIIVVMVLATYSGARYLHETIASSVRLSLERAHMVAALEETNAAVESANHAKSAFLATMSHELRTPLNGILGMAQMLLIADDLSAEQRADYVRTINTSGHVLLAILNDILDLSRIEAGRMELACASFDPAMLIRDSVNAFSSLAVSKGLSLSETWQGPVGRIYVGDVIRLRQMLSNLVNNAIKFTHEGFVRVEVFEVESTPSDALIEFSVTDSGIGIAPEVQARLFQPFTQADSSTTREFGGSGLGLSIVRRLAQLMHGEVGVHSEVGAGAKFWFRVRLPIDRDAALPVRKASVTGDSAAPIVMTNHSPEIPDQRETKAEPLAGASDHGADALPTVLVVDDNAVNRKVAEKLLGRLGVQAVCIENGQQCLDAIIDGMRPALILMDVQMPVMDGLDATRRIRAWELQLGEAPVPIVALTGGAFEDDIQRCLSAGMNDFLPKPLEMGRLEDVVARWRA
jgi:signal transduction histidine kinase/ActR/RegA family two-component response regulator